MQRHKHSAVPCLVRTKEQGKAPCQVPDLRKGLTQAGTAAMLQQQLCQQLQGGCRVRNRAPPKAQHPAPAHPRHLLEAEEQGTAPLGPVNLPGLVQRLLDDVPVVIVALREESSERGFGPQPASLPHTTQGLVPSLP